jgi:hypothetical protein
VSFGYCSAEVVSMRTRSSPQSQPCALGTVVCFVVGAVAMASSGVGVLIPENGRPGRDWIAAVDGAGGLFFVGAWLVILMRFWDRRAGGFLRHPSMGWAGDDSGADSRRRRVDAGDRLTSHPNRDELRTGAGLPRRRPGRHATLAVTGGRLSRNSVIFRPPR